MQKNINIQIPNIRLNEVSRGFLSQQVFVSFGPKAKQLSENILMFLKDRCTYGGHYQIDLSAQVDQYVDQLPKNEWTADASFSVSEPGREGQHQFTIAIAQSRADGGPKIETSSHSYPTYVDGDVARNRELFKEGKHHMNLDLFTSLRALLLGMADAADKIFLHGTMPGRSYNTFVIRDGEQLTRFTVSYKSTLADIAAEDEAAIRA